MKILQIAALSLLILSSVKSQNRYAKIIDIDNRPQVAKEILKYQNKFFIQHTGVCVDEDQHLLETCTGILSIDENTLIRDNLLIRKFSSGNQSLIADATNKLLYFAGEEYIKNDYPSRFFVHQIYPTPLSLQDSFFLHDDNPVKRKYFQLVANFFN